jgi:hypothetical protein
MTQEAADLIREWGTDEEIARAQLRADEARAAAEQARDEAERAIELAGCRTGSSRSSSGSR